MDGMDTEIGLAAVAVAAVMVLAIIGYYAARALIIGTSPFLQQLWALETALRRQNLPRPTEVQWSREEPLTVRWRVTVEELDRFADVDPRALTLVGDGQTIEAQMCDGRWRIPVVQ